MQQIHELFITRGFVLSHPIKNKLKTIKTGLPIEAVLFSL